MITLHNGSFCYFAVLLIFAIGGEVYIPFDKKQKWLYISPVMGFEEMLFEFLSEKLLMNLLFN